MSVQGTRSQDRRLSVLTKVPYVKSLMFSFRQASPIFMVGRESTRENWTSSAVTQEKRETGPGLITASGIYLDLVGVNLDTMSESLLHVLRVEVTQSQSTHSLVFDEIL